MQKINVRKISLAAMLVALALAFTNFYIPVGTAKCFPVQHVINILGAVLLGPVYSLATAFLISLLRNLLGSGSLLAFPGSMIGALSAALAYKYSRRLSLAFVGEITGTALLGALAAYPLAVFVLGRQAAVFAFVIPFLLSSSVGAVFGIIIVLALKKSGLLAKYNAATERIKSSEF